MKNERLAATLREAREVVGEVADDLEVHVELERRRGVPLFTGRADPRRLNDGAAGIPVDTENPIKRRRRAGARDAHTLRGDTEIGPPENAGLVCLSAPLRRTPTTVALAP